MHGVSACPKYDQDILENPKLQKCKRSTETSPLVFYSLRNLTFIIEESFWNFNSIFQFQHPLRCLYRCLLRYKMASCLELFFYQCYTGCSKHEEKFELAFEFHIAAVKSSDTDATCCHVSFYKDTFSSSFAILLQVFENSFQL